MGSSECGQHRRHLAAIQQSRRVRPVVRQGPASARADGRDWNRLPDPVAVRSGRARRDRRRARHRPGPARQRRPGRNGAREPEQIRGIRHSGDTGSRRFDGRIGACGNRFRPRRRIDQRTLPRPLPRRPGVRAAVRAAEANNAPIYLHPTTPHPAVMEAWFAPYVSDGMHLASWGFAAERGNSIPAAPRSRRPRSTLRCRRCPCRE